MLAISTDLNETLKIKDCFLLAHILTQPRQTSYSSYNFIIRSDCTVTLYILASRVDLTVTQHK